MSDLSDILSARGILAQAQAAGWEESAQDGRPGWTIPIFNIRGDTYPNRKWKSADGEQPKCRWLPAKPAGAKYYFLPGTLSEIAAKHGSAHLASGEPDVLAFRAGGILHTFCWLDGENSPPDTLTADLLAMGVSLLFVHPDRDQTGMKAAQKLKALLDGSGIEVIFSQLPGEIGSKHDVNWLWTDCGHDPVKFQVALIECPNLDPVDMHLYATAPKLDGEQRVERDLEGWRTQWTQDIIAALGTPAVVEMGKARWHCPLPGHEDRHPSFRISEDRKPGFPWPICTCGIQDDPGAWDRLAAAVNVDPWPEYKAARAAERGYLVRPITHHKALLPNATPQLANATPVARWTDNETALRKLREELANPNYANLNPPIPFPLTVLHHLGGFARFMRQGKLTAITGVSGGGKTTLARMVTLLLNQAGHDVIWWGPEWTPDEYSEADLQRAGGLTIDKLDELRLWRGAEAISQDHVVKLSAQYGLARVTDAEIQRSIGVIDNLLAVPGRMYFIPDMELPVQDVMATVRELAELKRREGRSVVAFMFDYVQLSDSGHEQDWKWAERIVGHIKAGCSPLAANLCGFVMSQPRKADSEKVLTGKGTVTQTSGQGLTSAQFNLYLTITPEYDEMGSTKDALRVDVVKNSRGRSGFVRLATDLSRSVILDRLATPPALNLAQRTNGRGYAVERVDHWSEAGDERSATEAEAR